MIQVIGVPSIGVVRAAPALSFWSFKLLSITTYEPLHMLSAPSCLSAHLRSAPRTGSWFGTASKRLPSGGRDAMHWMVIRLVAGVVTSGAESAPLGNTAADFRVSGVWRDLLSCRDSGRGRPASATCDSESESSGAGLALVLRYFRLVATTLA
jgi:hypothetical protein